MYQMKQKLNLLNQVKINFYQIRHMQAKVNIYQIK